jgi:hypothetical protein
LQCLVSRETGQVLSGSDSTFPISAFFSDDDLLILGIDFLAMKPRNWFRATAASLALASIIVAVGTISFAAFFTCAQDHALELRSPESVRGFVGGESHDSYAIRVSKGQTLTVQISWLHESDNQADFSVSESADFSGGIVGFGEKSNNGKSWNGKISKAGIYYIYVTAHPTAHYVLRVTAK